MLNVVSWLLCSSPTGNHNEDHFNYPQVVGSKLMWCECVYDLQGLLLARKVLRQSGHGMAAAFGRGLLALAFPACVSCSVAVAAASQCYKAFLKQWLVVRCPNI